MSAVRGRPDLTLEEAERHLLRGVQNIANQEERMEVLERAGQETISARTVLLETFLSTQLQFVAHRDRIVRELHGALGG